MSERRQEQLKLASMLLLLAGAGGLTYLFHARLGVGAVFTHLFYVPVVLASTWWGRRGIPTAVFLGGLLILSSLAVKKGGEAIGADVLRAGMFLVVSVVAAVLSEKVQAKQQRLRSLAAELAMAEEAQRRQLATGLHDRIGQTLAVLKLRLGALREEQADEALRVRLKEAMGLIGQVIKDARSLTFELCPPMLYELGLVPALKWLAGHTEESHGLAVELADDGLPKPLEQDVQVLLFRGAQELLMNVVKHARAERARVEVRTDAQEVVLTVADDGVGMKPVEAKDRKRRSSGFGLLNLRERLGYVKGRMEVDSPGGRGTRVTLHAPLRRQPVGPRGGPE